MKKWITAVSSLIMTCMLATLVFGADIDEIKTRGVIRHIGIPYANFVSGAGNTTTGYSGYQLAASGVATTNTLDLKIIRALNSADNLIGTTTNTNMNAKWLVKLNNYQYANQEAGAEAD